MNDLELIERLCPEFAMSEFGPRLVIRNLNTCMEADLRSGHGFVIKNKKSFDSKQKKYIDGIHSTNFGTNWGDDNAFKDRYSCKCGETNGMIYNNYTCPYCKTKVGYVDVDISKTGWIVMKHFEVINPSMYALLKKFFGAKALERILSFDAKPNIDGNYDLTRNNKKITGRYDGIGMVEFKKRFVEILIFYRNRFAKKQDPLKEKLFNEIIKKYDCVFTKGIPVFTNVLRPIFTSPSEYDYTKAERAYNVIIGCANTINKKSSKIKGYDLKPINITLLKIQEKFNAIDELIFQMIDKKEGLIHDGVLGGRVDFSARNVIIPGSSLRAFEIKLSYLGFLEVFKLEICNQLKKLTKCTYDEALKTWFDAHIKFSEIAYQVMKYLIKNTKEGIWCLVDRNPSIDVGSISCLKVVDITDDYNDMTLSLPIQILTKKNADFDGDTLSVYSIKSNKLKRKLKEHFNPANSFFISRNDGRFDRQSFLLKDQMIGLFTFATI